MPGVEMRCAPDTNLIVYERWQCNDCGVRVIDKVAESEEAPR